MKEEFESPVYHVHRVPVEKVRANSYNPCLLYTSPSPRD